MAKKIKFKIVVEADGKDVASEYIGFQVLHTLPSFKTNWKRVADFQAIFEHLATYPHSAVRAQVATTNSDPGVFEILVKQKDLNVKKALINNEAFLAWVSQEALIEMIRSDEGLAIELAQTIRSLQDCVQLDIAEIHKELMKINNYQVDYNLVYHAENKKITSKLKNHPDPDVAREAEAQLEN